MESEEEREGGCVERERGLRERESCDDMTEKVV